MGYELGNLRERANSLRRELQTARTQLRQIDARLADAARLQREREALLRSVARLEGGLRQLEATIIGKEEEERRERRTEHLALQRILTLPKPPPPFGVGYPYPTRSELRRERR